MFYLNVHLCRKLNNRKNFTKVIHDITFTKGEYNRLNQQKIKTFISDSEEDVDVDSYGEHLYEALYYFLEEKADRIKFIYENDELKIEASTAIPEYNIELINEEVNLSDLDSDNLESIYEFLESCDKGKIKGAIDVLENNPKFKKKAEKRYLNFIRARMNDENATLQDFPEATISLINRKLILGEDSYDQPLKLDRLNFSRLWDEDSKMIVDVLGSMIKNYYPISIKDRREELLKIKSEKEEPLLINLNKKWYKELKKNLKKARKTYSDGWFSKICLYIETHNIFNVSFDKTSFNDANDSFVLKEYMLLFSVCDCTFDIFQSDTPEFTEVFWTLNIVPNTIWSHEGISLPKCPLEFERGTLVRIGDENEYCYIKSLTMEEDLKEAEANML